MHKKQLKESRKVCSGEIDINYAQNRIYQNWTNYYEELFGPIV